jgi:hypothetical protein
MTYQTYRMVKGAEVLTFRQLDGAVVRVKRTKGNETLEVKLLTVAEARQLWKEVKALGYRLAR